MIICNINSVTGFPISIIFIAYFPILCPAIIIPYPISSKMCSSCNRVCSGTITCIPIIYRNHSFVIGLLKHIVIIIDSTCPALCIRAIPVTRRSCSSVCLYEICRCISRWSIHRRIPEKDIT